MKEHLYCKKDLYMTNGEKSFTKGCIYLVSDKNSERSYNLVDDYDYCHEISNDDDAGNWLRYFRKVTKTELQISKLIE